MVSIGSAKARPGQIDVGRLEVGETRDGASFGLPVAIINGSKPGDTLYIQAASDGDEMNGVGVVNQLVPQLNPSEISGKIIVIGIVNYHAFQVAQHRSPVDNRKMNRTYPGDSTGSSSERIADATFKIAKTADYALDLHQASTSRMLDEVRIRCGEDHPRHADCLELAKVFDCGFIYDQKGPRGQLARHLPGYGVPTIDPELGGCAGWEKKSIRKGVRGVYNVLYYYGFIDKDIEVKSQMRVTGFRHYATPVGGFVTYHATMGEKLEKGDPIFEITSVFGQQKTQVSTDSAGIFWRSRRLPQVATGEYVCSVGLNAKLC